MLQRSQLIAHLGSHTASFTEDQLDLLARSLPSYHLTPSPSYRLPPSPPYRPSRDMFFNDIINEEENVDMMECFRSLGRGVENCFEKKNSCKMLFVISIALAILSALCGILLDRFVAVLLAITMLVSLIMTSWAFIFRLKRQQIDYVVQNVGEYSRNSLPRI